MKTVAISQARTTSTRLPGKVLKVCRGRTLLEWHLERLKLCRAFDEVVLATTTNPSDDPLPALASRLGVRCFRGGEQDVLGRYLGAAREARADIVVRVTSDCPLWDPEEGARVVDALRARPPVDYACNIFERTLPRGLDTEAFWLDVLIRLERMAESGQNPDREHVTNALFDSGRAGLFAVRSVSGAIRGEDLRWCVDTAEDFACIEAIYDGLLDPFAPYPEVLSFVRSRPEIARLNQGVPQKTV